MHLPAGANDELDKHIAAANVKCTEFFAMMTKDKAQALLLPPYDFEVCWLSSMLTTFAFLCAPAGHGASASSDSAN